MSAVPGRVAEAGGFPLSIVLYAYQYSVYAWIARMVLHEKSVDHDYVEVNPFAPDVPGEYL